MRKFILFFFVNAFISNASADVLKDEAAKLFQQSKSSVFQVRVIDLSTHEKSSTGSGFFIGRHNYVVTNFHVVSAYVDKPKEHKIEIVNSGGEVLDVSLVSFDIVHDLAVLSAKQAHESALPLGNSKLEKGEKIFSMGNPLDLGMTIIEGTFNGLMEQSIDAKILFSGSLNHGMSGGPAINHLGQVIGVNVSTMGNEVSFLVPVECLIALIDNASAKEASANPPEIVWDHLVEDQMAKNQAHYIDTYLGKSWKKSELGDYSIPGEITPYVKCWGKTEDKKDSLMLKSSTNCGSDDYIYINDNFYFAEINYWFYWHKSKNLHFLKLYNHTQKDFQNLGNMNNADKEDVERFKCETNFVLIDHRSFKSVVCARQYKRFKSLYDISLYLVSVDEFNSSLMGGVTLFGVTKGKGFQFLERFMKEIRWKK